MKHKLFKAAQIIVCICLAAGVLGGCQNAQGLSDLTIIQGVGIDKSDDKTKVSLQYLNLNKSSSADSIGDKITAVASGEEQTVNGAIFNASKVLSKSMFFGQNKIIVFGSDYIQDGLRRGADYLIRSVDSRPDVLLALSSEKASDIIESKENDARIPTESIYELLTVGEQSGYSAAVTVNQLQNLYIDDMTDVYLPILSPGEDCVKCDGIAFFSKENYAAALNDDETFGFLLIKGRAKGGTLEIESSSLGNICAQINDELAMIHTVDFFPPVVDDPYMYGQIAAANALSDVYAMGGVPKLALNVVAFPNCLGPEVLEQILRGGADKVMEAGAVLAGGHTINDKEPKYGLCVTGYVHPDKMWKNYGAETGDILILTKPLGCGILNTAIKAEMAAQEEIERVQKIMAKLNKYAAEIASNYTIHSCTDVTGFSLAGHSLEMAKGSHKTLVIQSEKLPVIEGVEEYAQMGLIPEGAYRNRDFAGSEVRSEIKELWMEDLVFDPQTSGGLLLAVPQEEADALAEELSGMDIFGGVIGYVTEQQDKAVVFE